MEKEPKQIKEKRKRINEEFFALWTKEQLIKECIRLNNVLFDCLVTSLRIEKNLKKI